MKPVFERRWLLPAIVVILSLLLLFAGGESSSPAKAEAQLQAGVEGNILVIPLQLGRDSYGFAMVDTAGETLWIYEINNRGLAHSRLRLLATRSWKYDRLLEQYNTAEPKPEQVKLLLEKLGQQPKTAIEKSSGFDTSGAAGPDDSDN